MRLLDLLALVAPQVHHAQPVLFALEQLVQLGRSLAPACISRGNGLGGKPAKAVEQDALLRLVEAADGLALRVNQRQLRRQLLEHGHRGRLVVHEDASFARGENLAAQDDLVAFRVDAVFFEDGLGRARGLEDAGHHGLVRAVPNHFYGRLATH